MTCVKLCALVVLAVAVVATASPHHKGSMSDAARTAVKTCADQHNVQDIREAMHNPTAENGCFYDCLRSQVEGTITNTDSPMAKSLADCDATVTKTGDKCADAFEVKKCMKQKMEAHRNAKAE